MKKVFNLAVIFAALLLGTTFTSCSEDEDATVTIALDSSVITSGSAVTGTITSTDKLDEVTLIDDLTGSTVDGFPVTSFGENPITKNDAGDYSIRITGLADGYYTLVATDKNGVEDSETFIVGKTFDVSLGGSTSTAGSFLSIFDEAAYTTTEVNEGSAENVEIIFDGTTFKSADESANSNVSVYGKSATITKVSDTVYNYSTSTGFMGTITINSSNGTGGATTVSVTIVKISIAS